MTDEEFSDACMAAVERCAEILNDSPPQIRFRFAFSVVGNLMLNCVTSSPHDLQPIALDIFKDTLKKIEKEFGLCRH
jgi:hypothetical protein